jgi:hypothetical protein
MKRILKEAVANGGVKYNRLESEKRRKDVEDEIIEVRMRESSGCRADLPPSGVGGTGLIYS